MADHVMDLSRTLIQSISDRAKTANRNDSLLQLLALAGKDNEQAPSDLRLRIQAERIATGAGHLASGSCLAGACK